GLNAGLEAAVGQLVLEVVVLGEQLLDAVDEELLGADDEDLVQPLLLQFAQGHAVLLEELDELLAGDTPVLAAGDAVAAEPARIEPFTHRARRDFTDLRDLSGG